MSRKVEQSIPARNMIRRRRSCARRDDLNQRISPTSGRIGPEDIVKSRSGSCSNFIESFRRGSSDKDNVVVIMAKVSFPFIFRTVNRESLRIGVIGGICKTILDSTISNDHEFGVS